MLTKPKFPINVHPDAHLGRPSLRDSVTFTDPEPRKPMGMIQTLFWHALLVSSVAAATFMVTPAHSAGSMASDVRIIHVTPEQRSAIDLRNIRKEQAARTKEQAKAEARSELEAQKLESKRVIEADKAYYKRLENSRKRRNK